MIWYDMVLFGLIWYNTIWFDLIWYDSMIIFDLNWLDLGFYWYLKYHIYELIQRKIGYECSVQLSYNRRIYFDVGRNTFTGASIKNEKKTRLEFDDLSRPRCDGQCRILEGAVSSRVRGVLAVAVTRYKLLFTECPHSSSNVIYELWRAPGAHCCFPFRKKVLQQQSYMIHILYVYIYDIHMIPKKRTAVCSENWSPACRR